MANLQKTPPFPQFLAPFSRLFYTFFKRIFEQSGLPVAVRRHHLLECTILLLVLLRLVTLTFHLSWDPLGQYIAHRIELYDRYMLACLVCFFLYTLTTNWQLFLGEKGAKRFSWQAVAYDLTVRNADQAQRCRKPSQRSSLELNQAAKKPRSMRLLCHQFKNNLFQNQLDLSKLGHHRHQLAIFTFLSVSHRKRLLQFEFAANLLARLIFCLFSIPIFLGMTVHLILGIHATPVNLTLPGCLLFLTDLTFLWIIGPLFIRNSFLIFYFLTITSFSIKWHLKAAHRLLAYLMAKYRSNPFQGLNPWNRLLLRNFLAEHAQICALLDALNQQLVSLAVFSAFLFNVPTNIYLVYRLVYQPITLIEFTVLLFFIYAQILFMACAVVPLAQTNGALDRTGKYLPGVQLSVLRGERCRILKFKYEILQSTLTESRVKSGATIGPVCLITFESLYKVVTLYAVYMLVLFDLLPK